MYEIVEHGKKMKPKQGRKPDNPEQSKRFVQAAREAEADESKESADKAFKKLTSKPPTKAARERP